MTAHELVTGLGAEEARERQVAVDARADEIQRQQEITDGQYEDPDQLSNIMEQNKVSTRGLDPVQSWSCTRLDDLQVYIWFASETNTQGWDKQIFEQMSKLPEIYSLDVSIPFDRESGYQRTRGLRFSLLSGLTHLAGLEQLQSVYIDDGHYRLEEQDLEWMLNHSPSLEQLSSTLHIDAKTNKRLQQTARKCGVNLPMNYREDDEDDTDE